MVESWVSGQLANQLGNNLQGLHPNVAVDAFKNWASDHEEMWQKKADMLAYRDEDAGHFRDSYPCVID